MNFYLIGINHKSVPVNIRESAYQKRQAIELFCRDVLRGQAAVLSTCNRVEIYGVSKDISESRYVFNQLTSAFPEIFISAYFRNNTYATIYHALRLACGLESQIPGEIQISQQLRSWLERNTLPEGLRAQWNSILGWAEVIRSLTGLDHFKKDIADFTLEDIQKRIGSLDQKKLLIIGTGKVAELISRKNLESTSLYFMARKKHSRALKLAQRAKKKLVSFDQFPEIFSKADAIISATSSPHYIIKAGPLFDSIKNRKAPLYIYDLAAPRDVHPEVAGLANVRLYDMNDLFVSVEAYKRTIKTYLDRMELLIEDVVLLIAGEKNAQKDYRWNKAELAGV